MFTLQVLNSANEWELIVKLFKTAEDAEAFFYAELDMFEDFCIEQMEAA